MPTEPLSPAAEPDRLVLPVLDVPIDVVTPKEACLRIAGWADRQESRVVCICNAHSVVTAAREPRFMRAVSQADMATPDGAPVAWMLRRGGATQQLRVSGPDLMLDYCQHAASSGQSIFLFGSAEITLQKLQTRLLQRWPTLKIAGASSPPFRALKAEEDEAFVEQINESGAGVVFVSLGCPKQELWMAAHRGRVHAVMVGVGAAFDFHAGDVARAPLWMQKSGLEWLHRLASEPRRLWRRYLVTNSLFVIGAARQLFKKS
jgi:N-acetylglucosaminyldiphosphoundecaprenol N-acetyl-beta-D-mannosaminyltransferase